MPVTLGPLGSCRLIALIKTLQGANDVMSTLLRPLHRYANYFVYIHVLAKWLDEFKVCSN